jgi:hypothetical protein
VGLGGRFCLGDEIASVEVGEPADPASAGIEVLAGE